MQSLIRVINNIPGLKEGILSTIAMMKKSYMFISNKVIGVKENKIIFISFNGRSYSDNPRVISEKLHELHPEFEIVWLFNDPEKKKDIIPDYIRCVKNGSLRALKELATSKFWIDNFCKPLYIYKSEKQIYVQTWHGDRGFKKILHDSSFAPPGYKIVETKICDLAVSGSEYGNMQYTSAFKYDGEILQVGYPRNDILVQNNRNLANSIKSKLDINIETNILLYAPTLRREASQKKVNQDIGEIDLIEALSILEEKTKEKWICITRAHSAVSGLSGIPMSEKIIDVSLYEDMSDLLLVSNMLITDYSSSAGDFALLNRPIILFQNDRNEYLEKDRTFYFDIEDSPFLVAMNQQDLIKIIKQINLNDIENNCKSILNFYGTNETGKSSEAVINYLVSKVGGLSNGR
ncbi:CDP-glycerol glycerophosphotransferase family protein [Schinkia azotoformans]|uniref:CDP-glycerol glycerophosphotransferase family protein n=1 Tax=Schinkia azotoformans TaxID=1454 RepID=UPI002DB8ABEA|nr:CDP-glycerol glycerophosphotransferase family protein [Schinkia azotoformans]MEC1760389.1 CDP-glycerol glycerophosphotransferase family protein [Schinkia azotoformans]